MIHSFNQTKEISTNTRKANLKKMLRSLLRKKKFFLTNKLSHIMTIISQTFQMPNKCLASMNCLFCSNLKKKIAHKRN